MKYTPTENDTIIKITLKKAKVISFFQVGGSRIFWGDSEWNYIYNYNNHSYKNAGTYTIIITDNTKLQITSNEISKKTTFEIEIIQLGALLENLDSTFAKCVNIKPLKIKIPETIMSTSFMFYDSGLKSIDYLEIPNTVVDCTDMFYGCTRLTTIKELHLSNQGEYTNMFTMCLKLVDIPPIIIPEGVSKCASMFSHTGIEQIQNINIPSTVYDCREMFYNTPIAFIDNLHISGNEDEYCDAAGMFRNCVQLKKVSNTTFKYIGVCSMFHNCVKLSSLNNVSFINAEYDTNFFSESNSIKNLENISLVGLSTGELFFNLKNNKTNIINVKEYKSL